jgi:hypothetical protein
MSPISYVLTTCSRFKRKANYLPQKRQRYFSVASPMKHRCWVRLSKWQSIQCCGPIFGPPAAHSFTSQWQAGRPALFLLAVERIWMPSSSCGLHCHLCPKLAVLVRPVFFFFFFFFAVLKSPGRHELFVSRDEIYLLIYGLTTPQVTQSREGKKGKNSLCTMWKDVGSVEVQLHAFLTSALDWDPWSASCPAALQCHRNPYCPLNKRLGGPQSRFG